MAATLLSFPHTKIEPSPRSICLPRMMTIVQNRVRAEYARFNYPAGTVCYKFGGATYGLVEKMSANPASSMSR